MTTARHGVIPAAKADIEWETPQLPIALDKHESVAGSQYTSCPFTQVLDDHGVLGSIGSVGDAFDNALAESFVDSFKTELIADRRLAQQDTARARDRRIRRLVQPRPPARSARRHPARRVRATARREGRDFGQRIGRGALPEGRKSPLRAPA
jgi:hypothetical protein